VNVTVPVGVLLVPDDVSATVAEQLAVWPMTTGVLQELIVVDVARFVTERLKLLAPLEALLE
jgi:hypothetical protein